MAVKISFEEKIGLHLVKCPVPVLQNCEEKIDLEASRCFERKLEASEPFPGELEDGLADLILVRDWR